MSLNQEHSYWMADALKLPLNVNKTRVTAKGKLKVPTFEPLRLVCPLEVQGDMYREKVGESALLVKVRNALYIVIGFDGDKGYMWLVDVTKMKVKVKDLFKRAQTLDTVRTRLEGSVVKSYLYETLSDGWVPLVENMDK